MIFWKNKKVFITGHTGFKGSWLTLWLQYLGAEVTGYALAPPATLNLFTLANVANGMTSIIGDIRDYASLQQALNKQKPDIVIHMAAQSLVRHSYQEPVETYSTNVMGTVNLLEAVRQVDTIKALVPDYQSYFKFVFVRNPYTRILSEYFWSTGLKITEYSEFNPNEFHNWCSLFLSFLTSPLKYTRKLGINVAQPKAAAVTVIAETEVR